MTSHRPTLARLMRQKPLLCGLLALALFWPGFAWSALPPLSSLTAPTPKRTLSKACQVFIDAGHGGKDLGAQYDELLEKDLTLRWALAWERFLEQQGWSVQYSRNGDLSLGHDKRRELFDQSDCPILMSWHINTHSDPKVRGTEFYYGKPLPPPFRSYSKSFNPAELLTDLKMRQHQKKQQAWVENLAKSFSRSWRGSVRTRGAPLKLLHGTQKYAVLIEVGYLSHPEEREWLKQPDPQFFRSLFAALKEGSSIPSLSSFRER